MAFDAAQFALGIGQLGQHGIESGFELAQQDERIKMAQQAQRFQMENYVAEHDADQKFLQAFADTLAEPQPGTQPTTQPGEPLRAIQPAPATPPGMPAGSMGPSADAAEADQGQGTTVQMAPTAQTLTPAQAAQGAAAAGAPGLQGPPQQMPAPEPSPGDPMGPSPDETAAAPVPAQPPIAQYGPMGMPQRPGRPQTFAQKLVANIGPSALAHMSPHSKQMLESMLMEQGQYMVREQREMQDFREMMGANVFAYYNGDSQDPQGLDALVDKLETKVKLGLANPEELIKHASPQVAEALQQRYNYRIDQMRQYIATDYGANGEATFNPLSYAAHASDGFHTLEQLTNIKAQREDQYHAQQGRQQAGIDAANTRAGEANQTKRDIAGTAEQGRNERFDKSLESKENIAADELEFKKWKALPENNPPKGRSNAERGVKELVEANRFQQTKVGNQIRDLKQQLKDPAMMDTAGGISDKTKAAANHQQVVDLQGRLSKLDGIRKGLEDEATDLEGKLQGEINKPAPARTPPPGIIDRRRKATTGTPLDGAKAAFDSIAASGQAAAAPAAPGEDPAAKQQVIDQIDAMKARGMTADQIYDAMKANTDQSTPPE